MGTSVDSQDAVARFQRFIERHLSQPLRLSKICWALRLPERTLRAYCAQHIGMGPKQYLELRRMQTVREQLRAADPERETVAAIATRCGFRQLGRFSVRYRE